MDRAPAAASCSFSNSNVAWSPYHVIYYAMGVCLSPPAPSSILAIPQLAFEADTLLEMATWGR